MTNSKVGSDVATQQKNPIPDIQPLAPARLPGLMRCHKSRLQFALSSLGPVWTVWPGPQIRRTSSSAPSAPLPQASAAQAAPPSFLLKTPQSLTAGAEYGNKSKPTGFSARTTCLHLLDRVSSLMSELGVALVPPRLMDLVYARY